MKIIKCKLCKGQKFKINQDKNTYQLIFYCCNCGVGYSTYESIEKIKDLI